jgi:putative transposase
MGAPAKRLELTEEKVSTLRLWAASGTTQQRMAVRAQVVLAAAERLPLQGISSCTGLSVNACLKWRKRFSADRFEGFADKSGRGRPQSIPQEERLEVIAFTCTTPIDGSSLEHMEACGCDWTSRSAIHGILNAGDLKPHKVEHWCGKSPDPEFASKQASIIGLYMKSSVNAMVPCVDKIKH